MPQSRMGSMSVCAEERKSETGTLSSDETKARKAPAATPGMMSGSTTRRKVRQGEAPRAALLSSKAGSSPAAEAPMVRSAKGPVEVAPRDVVAAALPDPATIGPRMRGKTCAGMWVTGTGIDGNPREVYLYHVSDNEWTMAEYESQCVVWQTALNPVIALELLAAGTWSGSGVCGPEVFDAQPFLDLMALPEANGGYGQNWGLEERTPASR